MSVVICYNICNYKADRGNIMGENNQNIFCYRIAQIVSGFVTRFVFKRKVIRNEIKNIKGPFVVIANHQAAFDFVNLIGITRTPLTFVISNSFYNSLPIKGFMRKLGVIPILNTFALLKKAKILKF